MTRPALTGVILIAIVFDVIACTTAKSSSTTTAGHGGGSSGTGGSGPTAAVSGDTAGVGSAGHSGSSGGTSGSGGQASLAWYLTCGAPVCGGPSQAGSTGAAPCTTQKTGASCTKAGDLCDPKADCGENLICAASDPTQRPGGCPISRARYKRDIRYLDDAELHAVSEQLLRVPLAHWRYRIDSSARERLGFVIEDVEPSPSAEGDHVDLYGYTSMAVAALKVQAEQIKALEREVRQLRRSRSRHAH